MGIGLAIVLRIVLLLVLVAVIDAFEEPLFGIHIDHIVDGDFNLYSLIVMLGGAFIFYTAVKEIWHMLSLEAHEKTEDKQVRSTGSVIAMIVLMNIVFSFDSILSSMALTKDFWIMALATVIGGVLMIWLSDRVATFLQKNRMYEVLGLFILFLVGVMLLSEGGHLAHLGFFDHEIHAMSKGTFYFVLVVLVIVDVIQGRYQRKLVAAQDAAKEG